MHSIIIMLLQQIKNKQQDPGEADVLQLLRELLTQHINTFYHLVKFLQKVFRGKKCLFLVGQQMNQPIVVLGLGLGFSPLLFWTQSHENNQRCLNTILPLASVTLYTIVFDIVSTTVEILKASMTGLERLMIQ